MYDPAPERLSVQLKAIATRARTESITVGELLQALRGSPYLLLIALLSLPFLVPIPLFGLSTVIGIIISIFGFRLTLGQKPLLPKKILAVKIDTQFFPMLLNATSQFLRWVESFSRPRWHLLSSRGFLFNIYGFLILFSALLLLPPLPIPFSNFFPALTLVLLSLGLVERDGVFILLGIIAFVLTLAYFSFILWGGLEIFSHFWPSVVAWWDNLFVP